MISYTRGNIIDDALCGKIDVIAHSVNCLNTYLGLSCKLVEKFPSIAEVDQMHPAQDISKLGTATTVPIERTDGTYFSVFSLCTQYGYRKADPRAFLLREGHDIIIDQDVPHIDYWSFERSLLDMLTVLQQQTFHKEKRCFNIGLPFIGKGDGHALKLSRIIDRTIGFMDVSIYM